MSQQVEIPKEITPAVLNEQAKVQNIELEVFEEMYKAQLIKLTDQGVTEYDLQGQMINKEQLAFFSTISALKTKARSRQNVEGATVIIVGLGNSGKTKEKEQPYRAVYVIADMTIKPELFLGLKNDGHYVGFNATIWSSKKVTPGEVWTAKISRSGARFSLDLKEKATMPDEFELVTVMDQVLPLKAFRVLTWGSNKIERKDNSGSFDSAFMNVLVQSQDGKKEVVFISTTLDGWTKTAPDTGKVYYGDIVSKGEYHNLYSNPIEAVGKIITLDNIDSVENYQDFSNLDTLVEEPRPEEKYPGTTKIVVLQGFGSSEVTTVDTENGGIAAFAEISDIMNNAIPIAAFTDIFDSVVDSEGQLPPLIKVLAKLGWRLNKNTQEYELGANVLSIEPVGSFGKTGENKPVVDDIEEGW
jgi:hypothetical protein